MHSNGVIEAVLDVDGRVAGNIDASEIPLFAFIDIDVLQDAGEDVVKKFLEHGIWHLHVIGQVEIMPYRVLVRRQYTTVTRGATEEEKNEIMGLLEEVRRRNAPIPLS